MPTTKKVTVYTKTGKGSKAARMRAKRARVMSRSLVSTIGRQVHWFKRRASATTFQGDNVQNSRFFGTTFALSGVINAAEFSALFDQYKITGIKLNFYLVRNLGNAANVVGIRPRMYIVTDYDTSTSPTSFDELREYSNCRVHQFDDSKPFTYFIRPKILNEVYRTAVSTGTAPQRPPWVSTAHLDLQHFGMRLGIENILDSDVSIVMEPTLYFGCKNVK